MGEMMAKKPWLRQTYTLVIVPHAKAKFRKIKLPYYKLLLTGIATIAFVAALTVLLIHYFFMLGDASRVEQLAKENVKLKKEKIRYEQLTSEISHRINLISEKTKVLSTLAGVDQVMNLERGDIPDLSAQFGNEQLDRELPLRRVELNNLQTNLERVEKAFNEKQEELDYTPSVWPLISTEVGWISSNLGYRNDPLTGKRAYHNGIDISTSEGTPIIAPANGVVVEVSSSRTLGNTLGIDHMNGYTTIYGHLKAFNVKVGERITRGQIIGYLGNTGRSTGPHLHYEVRLNGKPVNPKLYILNNDTKAPSWDFQVASK
jgi:murein DD-endopeptidase MepM/ murein hydrolase activator NlpD